MERANKPLTLEQLREMRENTEIIGPSVLISWNGVMAYGVLDEHTDDGICAVVGAGVWLKEKDYGKSWLAYAQQPAHIDREKWVAEWIYPKSEFSLPVCSKCGCNSQDAMYGHKDNFCPKCGRAMNEAAWAETERRLMG